MNPTCTYSLVFGVINYILFCAGYWEMLLKNIYKCGYQKTFDFGGIIYTTKSQ